MRGRIVVSIGLAIALVFSVVPRASAATRVALELVAEGLASPVALVPLPDGRKLLVDQIGAVRLLGADGRFAVGEPEVLNLTNRIAALNHGAFDERGLLCLALHPAFPRNHRVFVTYNAPLRASAPTGYNCTLRLSEFSMSPGNPVRIDPDSERVLLEIDKPYRNHNGARLAFGPDGLLFMSVGDGGNANDQGMRPDTGNAQDTFNLLGKILRIDVDGARPFDIPRDNPFAGGRGGRPEIFAYGLRNAWGIAFDRGGNHALFAVDVGQNLFEEVDVIRKGGNYGWPLREGFHGFDQKAPNSSPDPGARIGTRGEAFVDPIAEYRHPGPRKDPEAIGVSVIGGYVYRGTALPSLSGHYVFADWSRGWALPQGNLLVAWRPPGDAAKGRWKVEVLEVAAPAKWTAYVTALGEDSDGELFVMTSGTSGLTRGSGRVWKLRPAE